MVSSPVRRGTVTWTKAMVQGAPKRAVEAATLIAPEGTKRLQLRRTTAQQQVASNTAANANIRYQEQSPGKSGGHSSSPGQGTQPPCKNCKSTKHTTKWCTSTKCYESNCGKSFKDAAERKAHYVREHGFYKSDDKQPPAGRKSSLKKNQSKPGASQVL